MPRPQKPDDVFKILKRHDNRFAVFINRGKGSHRMIYHPDIEGHARLFTIPYHKGRDLQRGYLNALIKRFNLPKDIFG